MNAIRPALRSLASLRLTVVLFVLSMVLILAGTLAQTQQGIWLVVDEYFRSILVLIPFQLFVPEKIVRLPGVFPSPGGLTLGVLLFANLKTAWTWAIGLLIGIDLVFGGFSPEASSNVSAICGHSWPTQAHSSLTISKSRGSSSRSSMPSRVVSSSSMLKPPPRSTSPASRCASP